MCKCFVPVSHCKDTHNFDKTNNFPKNICPLLCFLGIFGDHKGQNTNIFLKCGCKVGAGLGFCLPAFIVSTCGRWSGNSRYFANVSKNERNSLLLPALLLCAWWIACKYALFRVLRGFLAWFMGFVWVCSFYVLCVACVAFERVYG